MIKLITFDLDNTLWEVMPVIVKAEKTLRRWLGERVENYSEVITADVMGQLRLAALERDPGLVYNISDMRLLLLEEALTRCGLNQAKARLLAEEAFAVFMQGRNNVELYDGAEPMLQALAERYQLAALTNGNADISVMPIAKYFSFSMSPEKVQARKPEPEIFQATLQQAACTPQEVVHVGDNLHEDIAGAVGAGWRAVWVNVAGEDEPEAHNHSAQVSRLEDLPNVIRALDSR